MLWLMVLDMVVSVHHDSKFGSGRWTIKTLLQEMTVNRPAYTSDKASGHDSIR
jgi:hypothetical protein